MPGDFHQTPRGFSLCASAPHFGELAVGVDFKRIRTVGWSEPADSSEARVFFAARHAFRYIVPCLPCLIRPHSRHCRPINPRCSSLERFAVEAPSQTAALRRTLCPVRHRSLRACMGSSERHGGYGDVFPAQAASAFDAIRGGIGAGQGSAAWILER
jgi:hypothetical protein